VRPKLTIPAQVKDMKEAGITFDIVSEAEATRFLENSTYYFRIKAYAKNYEKYSSPEKSGRYINLDFAFLRELSTIDAYLRRNILVMAQDLEHFLKVKMLADFQKVDEDGYEIVQELFKMRPDLKDDIERKANTSTCNEIIKKYKDEWAIWNIVEVMSLGQFSDLYGLFYLRNKIDNSYKNMLLPVNMIRNAAAHNNCLINRLRPPYSRLITPSRELKYELSEYVGLSQKTSDKRLIHPAIHDFAALLYLYHRVTPDTTRRHVYNDLYELFNNRMLKRKEYFEKNEVIKSSYSYVAEIVNFYVTPENGIDK